MLEWLWNKFLNILEWKDLKLADSKIFYTHLERASKDLPAKIEETSQIQL